nr:hypothetical protein [Tanacetum cinerariifolium]
MVAFGLLMRMKIDIGDIMFNDIVTILTDTPLKKYVAYHRFISCVLESLLNTDYTQDASLGSTPSILRFPPEFDGPKLVRNSSRISARIWGAMSARRSERPQKGRRR